MTTLTKEKEYLHTKLETLLNTLGKLSSLLAKEFTDEDSLSFIDENETPLKFKIPDADQDASSYEKYLGEVYLYTRDNLTIDGRYSVIYNIPDASVEARAGIAELWVDAHSYCKAYEEYVGAQFGPEE